MDINELLPKNEMLLDIDDVLTGRTADQIARQLEGCTEDIRKAYGVQGEISFHITPNGLIAKWKDETEEDTMTAEEFEADRQQKVERRKAIVQEKAARRVEHLKRIAAGVS